METRLPVLLGVLGGLVAAALLPTPAHAVGDLVPPVSQASPPASSASAMFDVPYTAADDNGGSGVNHVDLYAEAPGELTYSLVATDTTPDTPVFSYTAAAGDGVYSFYTVATDNDGNVELPPVGDDGSTLLDTAAPDSSASAPATSSGGPIGVTYTASDAGSGVDSVELWVKRPRDAAYTLAATDSTPASPSFSYTPSAGDGSYSFYTIAINGAGTRESAPSSADATTLVDTAPPVSSASAPGTSTGSPITVSYTAGDQGTGVQSVELWVRRPGTSGYTLTDTDTTPDSPSFSYGPAAGDGSYSFYTIAIDGVGNREQAPSGPDATTVVQTPAPPPPPAAPPPPDSGSGSTAAQPPAPSPASSQPSLPLVAAVTLPSGQKLGTVLRRGLALRLFAYRAVTLRLVLTLVRPTAKALGLRDSRVASHTWRITTPRVYGLRLRLSKAAVAGLRPLRSVRLRLRSVVSAPGGGSSTTTSPLRLSRR